MEGGERVARHDDHQTSSVNTNETRPGPDEQSGASGDARATASEDAVGLENDCTIQQQTPGQEEEVSCLACQNCGTPIALKVRVNGF